MRLHTVFVILLALCAAACKKTQPPDADSPEVVNTELTNGLPNNPKKVNGYMFLSTEFIGSTSYPYYTISAYASFRDPASNAVGEFDHFRKMIVNFNSGMGVVFVGNVSAGDQILNRATHSYQSTITSSATIAGKWTTEGNGTFHPLSVELQRGYPGFKLNVAEIELSRAKGWQVMAEDLVQNADCVIVAPTVFAPEIVKRIKVAEGAKIVFSAAEVNKMFGTYSTLTVFVCNYSHLTKNNKLQLFELGNSRRYNLRYVD